MQQRQALPPKQRPGNCTDSLLKHHLITALDLTIHIHDPIHNGSGIELGIVPINAELAPAVFGIPMEGPHRVVQMVGLHLLDRDCAIFGGP